MINILKERVYPGKLLLFGEHSLLVGSQALAMPLHCFSGRWRVAADVQDRLFAFADYLEALTLPTHLNVAAFRQALSEGLYFDSNIPQGYGAGSSGALCAAVYDAFCTNPLALQRDADLPQLKAIFGKLESFFHGASSGFDPLICYLDQAVLVDPKKGMQRMNLAAPGNSRKEGIFLIDTGFPRQTGPLVQYFLERNQTPEFKQLCISDLIPATDDAIGAFIQQRWDLLMEFVHQISHFQFRFLPPMIPEMLRGIWLDGLSGTLYKLKLCGAGGGGFMLGFTGDREAVAERLSGWKLVWI